MDKSIFEKINGIRFDIANTVKKMDKLSEDLMILSSDVESIRSDLLSDILKLNEKTVSEANRENLCDKCGKPLTLVRPGKYQCDKCVD